MADFSGGYKMIDDSLSILFPFILWGILIDKMWFLVTKAAFYYIVIVIKISH